MARVVRLALFVIIAVAAIVYGYREGLRRAPERGESASEPRSVTARPLRGWNLHDDPSGFVVQVPRRWRVTRNGQSGRVDMVGPRGHSVVIWPAFIPTRFQADAAPAILSSFTAKILPGVAWGEPRVQGSTVRAVARPGKLEAVAAMTWAESPAGTAAYVYVAAAAAGTFHEEQGSFTHIIETFHIAGTRVGARTVAAQSFERWEDPREHAFSLDVPTGWKVDGGLVRFESVDARPAVVMVSPDGEIRVTAGDPEIPPFTEPSEGQQAAGSWYSPSEGVRLMTRRYATGLEFAREYALSRTAAGCSNVNFTEKRDRPDVSGAVDEARSRAEAGAAMRMSAGEVAFSCARSGRPSSGYCFAGTLRTEPPGGAAVWRVEMLYGYLAPSERLGEAQAALERAMSSFAYNPEWSQKQQKATAETSQIISAAHRRLTRSSGQGASDEIARRRANATLDLNEVIGGAKGLQIKVESGSSYYWIDDRGDIAGTRTDTKPDVNLGELIRLH
jgi:hypothetical protein